MKKKTRKKINTKKIIFVLGVCAIGVCLLWQGYRQTVPVESPETIDVLMERIQETVRGKIVTPKTTAELRDLMTPSTLSYVPRIFVDRLPTDFAIAGDKELFAKVILALILRENEKTLTDRAILLLLRQKQEAGIPWTEKETAFFDSLVKKYDSGARRTRLTKLADLETKINMIPPFIAVIQAAEATNWGTEHLDSPFEQTGWLDSKTYTRIPFDSLVKATESYAREMNGMPPFSDWRFSRFFLGSRGNTDVGYRALQWLGSYKLEDPEYSHKLYDRVKEFGFEIPDTANFWPDHLLTFDTMPLRIKSKTYQVSVAKTPEQKAQGLMFITDEIPSGTGMIFPGEKPLFISFWMKNTFLPLDVLFYDENNRITEIVENTTPLDETPHRSAKPVMGFIEFPAGTVQRDSIQVGDVITF